RLTKDRADVAEIVEGLLERAPREIVAALPTAKVGGYAKGPKPLDFSRAPDPARVARATRYAQLLAHSRPFAVAAAFNAKLKEATDETASSLRSYGEDLLREVRAAEAEGESHVNAHLELMLSLSKLVVGEEETEFLRRRARVKATA